MIAHHHSNNNLSSSPTLTSSIPPSKRIAQKFLQEFFEKNSRILENYGSNQFDAIVQITSSSSRFLSSSSLPSPSLYSSKPFSTLASSLFILRQSSCVPTTTSRDRDRFFFFNESPIDACLVTLCFGTKTDLILHRGKLLQKNNNNNNSKKSDYSSSSSSFYFVQFYLNPKEFTEVFLCTKDSAFWGIVDASRMKIVVGDSSGSSSQKEMKKKEI